LAASCENVCAISRNASQSLLLSHGGETAALNGWMNGCRSVLLISNFSYQVAAGSTISENRPELVMRKSMLTNRSVFPSGGCSSTCTSCGCHECVVSVRTESSPPIRCFTKYSWPFPLSPSRLDRQLKKTRGKLRGSFGCSTAQSSSPFASLFATLRMSVSSSAPASRCSLTISSEFCDV